jgi:hypothetical protein
MSSPVVQEAALPGKVLMSAAASEQTIQVLEYPDGALTIALNGVSPPHYRWQRNQVEACIRTYMRLLRR